MTGAAPYQGWCADDWDGQPEEAALTALLEESAEDLYENSLCGHLSTLLLRARTEAERERERLQRLVATLQRSLLPPVLPSVPGLQTAAYYHAASLDELGGDFYDLFPLGDDRWGLFLRDVCGKGAHAAALTSLIRYTLRAAAVFDPDDAVFARTTIRLAPGDTLLLYTDGLTDAHTTDGRYGDDSLLRLGQTLAPTSAAAAVSSVRDLLRSFGDGVDDDTAILGLSIDPAGQ